MRRSFSKLAPGSMACISESSIHFYMPDWAYLKQKSGQTTVKECSVHKIKPFVKSTPLKTPVKTPRRLMIEFDFCSFLLFWVIFLLGAQLTISGESWVVIYVLPGTVRFYSDLLHFKGFVVKLDIQPDGNCPKLVVSSTFFLIKTLFIRIIETGNKMRNTGRFL